MLFDDYNEAKAIASLLCPYLRARSSKTPFRCIAAPDDPLFDYSYRMLQLLGARKSFFQSKNSFVIDSILHSDFFFEKAHPIIELCCTTAKQGFWTGAGVFKENSATEANLLSGMLSALGAGPIRPAALLQIDVTAIWHEIHPLLEKLDPAEREAERQRRRQAIVDSIPIVNGPPADPKTAAEINRRIAEITGKNKPNRILDETLESSLTLPKEVAPEEVDLDALVCEGQRIRRREGMTPEDIQAFQLFYQAAVMGHAEAQYLLSECYRHGYGVQINDMANLEWLRKSAESGFAMSQCELGHRYHEGTGVPQDYTEALKCYHRAAEQGYEVAQYNLGLCYERGQGASQDWAEATKWYRKAAEHGSPLAQYCLGACYALGNGVPKEFPEAAKWYRKAAEQGLSSAQCRLGLCYEQGQGVLQDWAEATKWYRKAAERGHARAQSYIASCYYFGKGVEVDRLQAYAWMQLAADQEAEGAKEAREAATLMASAMSPRDLKTAQLLYREFKERYPARR